MEDALALRMNLRSSLLITVLILVVMEDALAPGILVSEIRREDSLNPCCNGRCTRTKKVRVEETKKTIVLILVVMEDALAQITIMNAMNNFTGLNPCCNGRCTRTNKKNYKG